MRQPGEYLGHNREAVATRVKQLKSMRSELAIIFHAQSQVVSGLRCGSRGPAEDEKASSVHDLDSLPKGIVAANFLSGRLWVRVIPARVDIRLRIGDDSLIIGDAFPRAGRMVIARFEELTLDALRREIMIPLNDASRVALGDDDIVPNCFHAGSFADERAHGLPIKNP